MFQKMRQLSESYIPPAPFNYPPSCFMPLSPSPSLSPRIHIYTHLLSAPLKCPFNTFLTSRLRQTLSTLIQNSSFSQPASILPTSIKWPKTSSNKPKTPPKKQIMAHKPTNQASHQIQCLIPLVPPIQHPGTNYYHGCDDEIEDFL